jgi:hypothetical protein
MKKLGRIPHGGDWRAHARGHPARSRAGYAYIQTVIDGSSHA